MTREEIYLKIVDIMDNHGLTMNDDLETDIDSLSFIATIVEIEQTFKIIIPDEYLTIRNFKYKKFVNCIVAMLLSDD